MYLLHIWVVYEIWLWYRFSYDMGHFKTLLKHLWFMNSCYGKLFPVIIILMALTLNKCPCYHGRSEKSSISVQKYLGESVLCNCKDTACYALSQELLPLQDLQYGTKGVYVLIIGYASFICKFSNYRMVFL